MAQRFFPSVLLVTAAFFASAQAQLPTPTLHAIHPPGGQAGTTVEVRLRGENLDDLSALVFSEESIRAERVMLPAGPIWPEPRPDGLKFRVTIPPDVPSGLYHEARSGTLAWGTDDASKEALHGRLSAGLPLSVLGDEPQLLTVSAKEDQLWTVELGKTLEIPLQITRHESIKGGVTVAPQGLPGFTRPPNVTIAEKDREGVLKIRFRQDRRNKPFAGRGTLLLRATATASYRVNPEAVARLDRWKQELEARAAEFAAAKEGRRIRRRQGWGTGKASQDRPPGTRQAANPSCRAGQSEGGEVPCLVEPHPPRDCRTEEQEEVVAHALCPEPVFPR